MKRNKLILLMLIVLGFTPVYGDSLDSSLDPPDHPEVAEGYTGTMDEVPAQVAESSDLFRKSGKIYVVVGVLVIIFTGVFLFLLNLERRIKRLEKEPR